MLNFEIVSDKNILDCNEQIKEKKTSNKVLKKSSETPLSDHCVMGTITGTVFGHIWFPVPVLQSLIKPSGHTPPS